MTEEHVRELHKLNPGLNRTLEEVRVASLRFATFSACHLFLNEFDQQLRMVGSIDAETFNQVSRIFTKVIFRIFPLENLLSNFQLQSERMELATLVKQFSVQGVVIKCCDIFNFDF